MKNYKLAKTFIITTAVLSCVIVILTFALSYFKTAKVIRPDELITRELIQSTTSIVVTYRGESATFEKEDEVRRITERFLELTLNEASGDTELPGKIVFNTVHPDSKEETTVEVGFDEKLESIQLNEKMYSGVDLLKLKNLLVTLTMGDLIPPATTTEPTTEPTTTTTQAEDTTNKETAFYSTDNEKFDWGGSKVYTAIAGLSENRDDLIKDKDKNFPVIRITDKSKLDSFISSLEGKFELKTEKYNDEFFAEKELYVIYAEENSANSGYTVTGVDINKKSLRIKLEPSGLKGQGLASRIIYLSIERDAVKKCDTFAAYSEY